MSIDAQTDTVALRSWFTKRDNWIVRIWDAANAVQIEDRVAAGSSQVLHAETGPLLYPGERAVLGVEWIK